MDNFRRRARRESEEQLKYATAPIMTDLLDAVDNLNRALESVANCDSNQGLAEGVKMVAEQLSGLLSQYGCEHIPAVGERFDPNLHQAVQMMPSTDTPAEHVAQELRSGFRLHDRVLRPAQVIVSTGEQ
ncbi:MAG: nucleotide exchange factor GrpE [Pirellulaceae bacterium]